MEGLSEHPSNEGGTVYLTMHGVAADPPLLAGADVGGKAEPLFVIATDVQANRIFVGQGQSHPGLYRKGLKILSDEVHWIRDDLRMQVGEEREYLVRIRYRQPLQAATLIQTDLGLYIVFREAQRGIAAGQFAAWYQGDELIGSGVIQH